MQRSASVLLALVVALFTTLLAAPGLTAQCSETSVPMWGGPQTGAEFGFAAAMTEDVAVVGAPGWESSPGVPIGLVTVARWNGSSWVPERLSVPTTVQPGDRYGAAVAVNEDASVIAVGAPLHDGAAADSGLLVIYEWNAGLGSYEVAAEWEGAFATGLYGFALDASGDRILVGEPGALFAAGVVTVYKRVIPKAWSAEAFWVGVPGDALGWSVAIEGGVMAMGAPLADPSSLADAGMVYTKAWDGATWVTREDIPGWNPGDLSGWAVDVYDDYLTIGQPGFHSNSGHGMVGTWDGSLYDFWAGVYDGSGNGGRIGHAVTISYQACAVGAPEKAHPTAGAQAGEIRLMQHVDDLLWAWEHHDPTNLPGTAPQAGAQYGFALASHDWQLLVGAPFEDVAGLDDAGSVKVLELQGGIGFVNEGHALAGYAGKAPYLKGVSGMCDDPQMYLMMTEARPSAFVTLVLGLSKLAAPFKGGVMVPDADLVLPYAWTWPDGSIAAGGKAPVGLPAYSLWLQAWIVDPDGPAGFSASNGIRIDVPAY